MIKSIRRMIALLTAVMCLFTCAFAENGSNVVATYNGGEVTLSEVQNDLASEISMVSSTQSYINQLVGSEAYSMTEEHLNKIREYITVAYAEYEILLSKMTELGIPDLTDEEKANLRKNAEFYFLQYVYSYTQQGISADDAAYSLNMQGVTIDTLYTNSYRNAIQTKIANSLTISEDVSDDEITEKYESLAADYEKNYANAPAAVESAANSAGAVYYIPENMRYIKHIIIIPDDEELMNQYSEAIAALRMYENEYASITAPSYVPKYDAIIEKAIKDECIENIDLFKKTVEELQAKVFEFAMPEAEKVLNGIAAGESFDALIEAYSDDPGSEREPIKTNGYLVYKNSSAWDEAFIEAANALNAPGDVSKPVVGELGVYIVKFESEPVSGKVPLEEVKEHVISSIISERRSQAYKELTDGWFEHADIQVDLSAF